MNCLFVNIPKECTGCLESKKIQCLLNHLGQKVSDDGKVHLQNLLTKECSESRRIQ